MHHLKLVLETLHKYQSFAKKSKCSFECSEIDYLGHLITLKGVRDDPSKIESMVNWPFSTTLKSLYGFLGLMGYYRKFIKKTMA